MSETAFVFAGQGSQSTGMLSAYHKHPLLMEVVAEVSNAIDTDIESIIENDGDALNQTINTQPCMLAMGVGVYRMLENKLQATVFAGHSLGEYSALVCAGSLSLAEAAKLVRQRAYLMQSTVNNGGMAAILGLDADSINEICTAARNDGEFIWAANYNTEKQIVVAGIKSSIEKYIDVFKQKGARRVVVLPMSVPSHCPLLQEAANQFKEAMKQITLSQPQVTILHTGQIEKPSDSFANDLINTMANQLILPVNWLLILQQLKKRGVEQVFEVGPGKILTGLGKDSGIPHKALNNTDAIHAILNS